jgi:predicted small secreted protein
MRLLRLCLLALPLTLSACNANGARAQGDFNAAGNNLGQSHIGSGFKDIGQGFSDGANATGDAIVHAAHEVGNAFSQ